jgi:hypothetical protein
MRRTPLAVAALFALAGTGWGCRGDETGPAARELVVRVSAPGAGARAMVLRLVGPQTAVAAAQSGDRVYSLSVSGDTAFIAVVAARDRTIAAGDLLRLSVPATRDVGGYAATVTQAAGADYQLQDPASYALVVATP